MTRKTWITMIRQVFRSILLTKRSISWMNWNCARKTVRSCSRRRKILKKVIKNIETKFFGEIFGHFSMGILFIENLFKTLREWGFPHLIYTPPRPRITKCGKCTWKNLNWKSWKLMCQDRYRLIRYAMSFKHFARAQRSCFIVLFRCSKLADEFSSKYLGCFYYVMFLRSRKSFKNFTQ